jgi:DNA-binding NarL/FixJ family response regulator
VIRVLIADDHAVVRAGVEQALTGHANVQLAGSAGAGPEAVTLARCGYLLKDAEPEDLVAAVRAAAAGEAPLAPKASASER